MPIIGSSGVARLAVAAIVRDAAAVGQQEVDPLRAVERAAAAERDDRIDAQRLGEAAPGLDHRAVRVLAEVVKGHDFDRPRLRATAIAVATWPGLAGRRDRRRGACGGSRARARAGPRVRRCPGRTRRACAAQNRTEPSAVNSTILETLRRSASSPRHPDRSPADMHTSNRLTPIQWLICVIAAIGFAFDIYEMLMLPLIVRPALLELRRRRPGIARVSRVGRAAVLHPGVLPAASSACSAAT